MKKKLLVRFNAMLLVLVMTLSLIGCGLPGKKDIQCVGCLVAGETAVASDGKVYVAKAILPEGYAVDHWEINGEPADAGDRIYSLQFKADFKGIVKPVLRKAKTVTAINAEIHMLDDNGKADPGRYKSVVFEWDYTNPATGKDVKGGVISFEVRADVPAGKAVDYWLINGAAYIFENSEKAFKVVGLTESRTYEVVLKDKGAKGTFDGDFTPPVEPKDPEDKLIPPVIVTIPTEEDPNPFDDEPIIPGDDPNDDTPDPDGDEPVDPGDDPKDPGDDPFTPIDDPDDPGDSDPTPKQKANNPSSSKKKDNDKKDKKNKTDQDETYGETCRHQWVLVERTDPTCTAAGEYLYECSICGAHEYVSNGAALGHDWETYRDESGTMYSRCRRCGLEPKG